ncbi:MAG: hypothetical protein GY854_33440 [Deltaproteobacteria bacterium]|nr:hypothetical protein [Deltaproteobacteria bacterium]
MKTQTLNTHKIACLISLLLMLGCSDKKATDSTPSTDEPDSSDIDEPDSGTSDEPTNTAMVFELDPVSTPTPTAVELKWIADDADGKLTSELDEAGIRKIKIVSCVDEGATMSSRGFEDVRICTLKQLADKDELGSFMYDDWQDEVKGLYNPSNVHAEVSAYYHVQKVYEFVTSPQIGVFDRLPGRHEVDSKKVPLTVVVNYQLPTPADASSLEPVDVAFFATHESLEMGMSFFQGLEGIHGDVIAFGQGEHADFAYAGATIYHEFGHAVVNSLASIGHEHADEYGITNMARALNEGLANTFAFLVSEKKTMGEYLTQASGFDFTFDSDDDSVFPRDLKGSPVSDGYPIMGANYEIMELMKSEGFTRYDFTSLMLLTLDDMVTVDERATFAQYCEGFLSTMESEGFGRLTAAADRVFEGRGLFTKIRAKDISDYQAQDSNILYVGGAIYAPWNTSIMIQDGDQWTTLSTAYVQTFVTTSVGDEAIELSASLVETRSSMFEVKDDWDLRVYLREGAPIIFDYNNDVATVQFDREIAPVIEGSEARWTIDGLNEQSTYYMLFVNLGDSPVWMSQMNVERQ